VWCHPRYTSQFPREETRVTDGEYQLGICARVALVSLTLSASLGLAGCAAIDDLKVNIFQWFDTVNSTGEDEEPLAYAPEPRLIPPAEIPKRAAKAPRKILKAKPQRPPVVVLPQEKPQISDAPETATPGETEGQSARTTSIRLRTPDPETPSSFEDRFCAKCWGLPGKTE
jgi:hypothetical protein